MAGGVMLAVDVDPARVQRRLEGRYLDEIADDLDDAVDRVVGELLTSGPQAAREAKQLVRTAPAPLETAHIAARLRTSPEGQDGLRAFLERRAASWR
jgi:methylglutaconyl-CoA hydratase